MEVYIDSYIKNNLGDDLFIDILSNRYDENFHLYSNNGYGKIFKDKIKVYDSKIYKIINKLMNIISHGKYNMKALLSKKSDISIVIGGSLFMEEFEKRKRFILHTPYYILGTNFGPYSTDKYYKSYYDIFKNAEDVCFRERYSKDLFKELNNVRYAPDIVFSLDTKSIKINKDSHEKRAVISVINCERKRLSKHENEYRNNIIELIKLLLKKEYEITLMSFCKADGDEEFIENIYDELEHKEKIHKYYYDGNIKEALNVLANSKVIFGTRLHANIIGLVLGKTVIPIAYSDKTINVFKDMSFNGKIFDIRDKENFDLTNITDEDLNYKFNIDTQIEGANKHFEKLDKVLKRRENNE